MRVISNPPPPGAAAIKRYVVTLRDRSATRSDAAALLGITVEHAAHVQQSRLARGPRPATFFDGLGAIAADLHDREVDALCRSDEIAEVIEDVDSRARKSAAPGTEPTGSPHETSMDVSAETFVEATPVGTPPGLPSAGRPPWNIELIRADLVWDRATGLGVRVALLDTGIAEDHPDVPVAGGVSFVPDVTSWTDDNGHGTHCAGIIGARNWSTGRIGVAPGCDLFAVKVLASDGRGALSSILAGMLWSADHGMHVVSVNVASPVGEYDSGFIVYQRAAERCRAAGALVLAPAGNSGNTSTPWVRQPARCPGIVAVGAANRRGDIARFTSRGPTGLPAHCDVEICAPGVGIRSTLAGGGDRNMSGTSMACVHVAGAAALLKEINGDWPPHRLRARLCESARRIGATTDGGSRIRRLLDCGNIRELGS